MSRHVPLSEPAVAIIEALQRSGPWLLPNPATGPPYGDIKPAWMTARNAVGLDDLYIHDTRHSAASLTINAGIDLFAVGRVIGHTEHHSARAAGPRRSTIDHAQFAPPARHPDEGGRGPRDRLALTSLLFTSCRS